MSRLIVQTIEAAGSFLAQRCHAASRGAGWWLPEDIADMAARTRAGLAISGLKIALIHSEVSEALEGVRKGRQDEHLPHRTSEEVELADAIIRIMDYAGARGLDIGGAIEEKMAYNAKREDHKVEARTAIGGKAF
jgi:NTP pyrophosphatase (non-canonical NTP hydrolase)